ncbi:helix-turn-helix domain-containing protein [Streptomyces sp. NPDC006283]|uniref:helix-turn-helix domain-containing protein n=1 Tax=Streptomyces sp. NPDC006283 TaxID=3156741 RepID=UPI0033A75892
MEDATEAFAHRLNELREGSGRTYGALARRVGVGASTLHRYCSGRTVPMDFAPVERLARLCGCQGEDLVALHRLWVLADEDRTLRQERATQAATEKAGARDDALGGPAAAAAAAPSRPADDGAPGPTDPPAADPAAAITKATATATAAPRRSRRAAYAAAFGAAGVAFALVLGFGGFTLTSGKERASTTDAERGEPGPPRAGAAPSVPSSASPGPTEPPAEASPRGGSRKTAPRSTVPPGPRGRSSPAAGAAPSTGAPFTWVSDDHVWRYGCDHAYLVDRAPGDVPPPPAEADAESWARSLRARHGAETGVRITLQGTGTETVVLESLQVRVTARRAPEPRNVYRMDSGCGGSLTPRLFDVDLDMPRPIAHAKAGNDAGETIPAVSFPYRISANDPEMLLVTGRTVACDCDWYLQLRWSSGGRSGTVRIDDDGRPFRTSAVRDGQEYGYDYVSRRWVSSPRT